MLWRIRSSRSGVARTALSHSFEAEPQRPAGYRRLLFFQHEDTVDKPQRPAISDRNIGIADKRRKLCPLIFGKRFIENDADGTLKAVPVDKDRDLSKGKPTPLSATRISPL